MALAKAKAQEIIRQFAINSPEVLGHLEDLCWALGAVVRRAPMTGAEARLTIKGNQGIITVSAQETYLTRTRYSIGHELGHFLLHKDSSSGMWCGQEQMNSWFGKLQEQKRENDANEFASELLLPESLLKSTVQKSKPCFEFVEQLSNEFQTSLTATARRFVELSPEAVALVSYTREGVRWFFPSELFKRQQYWITQGKLDSYTLAFDAVAGKNPTKMETVDAIAWFEVKSWLKDEMVREQTRFFTDAGFGLSLVWIDNSKLIWT